MADNQANHLVLPGLSRPFGLGMLYDCRSDHLIPGMTLWDKTNIEKDIVTRPQYTTGFNIIASDTIGSKSSALDIDANLKLSFMGGLISVTGSAKYLDDRTSSHNQSRVTMQYKCTTVFKQLSMSHLGKGNVKHPDVFDQGHATHVVAGILYGAQAFLVFDRHFSDEEMKKNIEGELHVLVKALPGIKIDGNADLKMSEDEKEKADKLEVQFHGDFRIHANPTSYEEAVKLYKDLPNLLGPNQENAVPVTVWLHPLTSFDSKAARLVRGVSANLVNQTEECMEQFHILGTRCNDLLNSLACRSFQGIRDKLSKFRDMVNNYKHVFTQQLMPILPKIRGGGAEESELLQVILNKEQSPFSHHLLVEWLDNCEEQIQVMGTYISSMESVISASNPGDLSAAKMHPTRRHCVCFNFQLLAKDQLVSAMEAYLPRYNEASYNPERVSEGDVSLFDRVKSEMVANGRNFIDFHKANTGRSGTAFIIAEDKMITDKPGAFIHLYKDGRLIDNDFKPPSKPGKPREEHSTHDELEVTWKQPDTGSGNITHYIVSWKTFSSDAWTEADTKDTCLRFIIQKLIPSTPYEVKVTAACEAGSSLDSDINIITTRPTNPPVKPKVWQASALKIGIEWVRPTIVGEKVTIKSYDIERCSTTGRDKEKWVPCGFTGETVLSCDIPQEVDVQFRYRVVSNCGEMSSLPSDTSEVITITASRGEILKELVRVDSKKEGNSKNPSFFQVPLTKVTANSANMVRKITFGKPKPGVPEKVILIVGATGAGKTTFINGIMNYLLDVKWKDDFRFKLVEEDVASNQAISQTQWITAYTLHHQEGFQIPYTLTIIDTPGFGDTTGIERDKRITEQLRQFFQTEGEGGIDHIDAVGFVTQASLPRLTPSQRYIFDSILSLFGKDIAKNIFLLITFGDGQKPPVLAGVKEADLPYAKFFKFNNSALFASNVEGASAGHDDDDNDDDDDEGQFDKMFWQMGVGSYKKFLAQLNTIEAQSLTLTKTVLEERNQLELVVSGIQSQIQTGLNTLEQLKTEVEVLNTHKADIEKNKSFTYTVKEEKMIKIDIPTGSYTTNCIKCNFTCHFPCGIPQDADKSSCLAMFCNPDDSGELNLDFSDSGNCKVCPGKCHWKMHHNVPYRFETKIEDVVKTSENLKKRYETAKDKHMSAEKLIEKVVDDFTAVQMNVLSMTNEVRKLINHLQEIALKPDPLSAVEYIDILIESEKSSAKPGWKERVSHLTDVRKEAETLARLAKDGYDPFERYQEILREAKAATKDEKTGEFRLVPNWLRKAGKIVKGLVK